MVRSEQGSVAMVKTPAGVGLKRLLGRDVRRVAESGQSAPFASYVGAHRRDRPCAERDAGAAAGLQRLPRWSGSTPIADQFVGVVHAADIDDELEAGTLLPASVTFFSRMSDAVVLPSALLIMQVRRRSASSGNPASDHNGRWPRWDWRGVSPSTVDQRMVSAWQDWSQCLPGTTSASTLDARWL
jgi:hypothetical protein